MIYNKETIDRIRREMLKPGGVVWISQSRANKALTLFAAHRLISSLADQTNSRSELEECREVMNQLERMVEEG